jgi:hypothetical protein
MIMQERIRQDAVDDTNPSWPEGTYDWLVYGDEYFASTHALLVKHAPSVMAQLLHAINWPMMAAIVTLGDNFGMAILTNHKACGAGGGGG